MILGYAAFSVMIALLCIVFDYALSQIGVGYTRLKFRNLLIISTLWPLAPIAISLAILHTVLEARKSLPKDEDD